MPSAKVVFTYKRKRLSSGSTVGDEDVYPGKIKAAKDNDFSKECVSTDHERGLGEGNHTKHSEASQSSLCVHYIPKVNISNDSISKLTEENSAPTLLEETEKSKKDSFSSLGLGGLLCDKHIGNGSEPQTENRDENMLSVDKRRPDDKDIAKSSDTSPLITFSRRLKRKADVLRKLPVKECTADEKSSSVSRQNIDANEKQVPYEDESTVCSRFDADSCSRSRSEMILSETVNGKSSDGVVSLDNLASDKQILPEKVTKLNASVVSEATGVRNPPKITVGCLLSEQAQVSYNDESKTDQGASNGTNSQLTSSDGSDSKVLPRSKGKGLADSQASLNSYAPLTDSLVIDCNASPESDVQEETDFSRDYSNTAAAECSKGKALKLFETSGERMDETRMAYPSQLSKNASSSSMGVDESRFCRFSNDYANTATNLLPPNGIESKSTCLQLFPEGRGSSVHVAGTLTETTHTCGERIAISSFGGEKERTEHSLLKPPVSIGMSLQTDSLLEGHHRASSRFQNFRSLDVGLGDPIQDAVSHHPFLDSSASSALRHKKLLNNINSRASALQVSRFELSPNLPIWTEDELDSLWIGVRRHGRGNWDSILRDPRLRFSPWRKASDLVQQWIIEQQKLVSKSQSQNPRPQVVLTDFNHSRPLPSHSEVHRNCAWADAQLSLGDLIPPKERGFFSTGGWGQNHVGIGQGSNQVAGPRNNFLPHWLREAGNVSPLKVAMPFLGAASLGFQLQQPSLGPSTVLCGGLMASQLLNPSTVSLNHHEKNVLTRRVSLNHHEKNVLPRRVRASGKAKGGIPDASNPSGSKAAGIIVVESDASSEETISDEHNNGHHRWR